MKTDKPEKTGVSRRNFIKVATMGGPKINPKAQVVDAYDRVIPRLYAAGNASSGAWGFYYNGGGGNSDAFAFGRIAGRNAAAEAAL